MPAAEDVSEASTPCLDEVGMPHGNKAESVPRSPRDITSFVDYGADEDPEQGFRRIISEIRGEEVAPMELLTTLAGAIGQVASDQPLSDDLKMSLLEAGGLEVILQVLRKGMSARSVQATAHKLLDNLAQENEAVQERIGELQGIQLLIHSMLRYKQDLQIQKTATKALLGLTPVDRNRTLIGHFFGIEVTISTMKSFPAVCELQSSCCALLGNAVYKNMPNKETVVKAGGIKAVLRGMKKCREDAVVAFWGSLVLRNITLGYEEAKDKVAEQRGLKAIMIAMVTFKEEAEVQVQGCAALRNITEGHDRNARQLVEMRGLEVLVRCMKRFRTIFSVQEDTISMMKNIVHVDEWCTKMIVNAGGIEAVLSSMIQYRSHKALQESIITILHKIAAVGDDMKQRILDAGGVQAINATLRVYLLDLDFVEQGVATLQFIRNR